jgi:hypothetical protein
MLGRTGLDEREAVRLLYPQEAMSGKADERFRLNTQGLKPNSGNLNSHSPPPAQWAFEDERIARPKMTQP